MRSVGGSLILSLLLVFSSAAAVAQQEESLGDYARRLRAEKRSEVQITLEESNQLFQSMDEILAFASRDSGLPRRATVRHQLVSQSDFSQRVTGAAPDEDSRERRVEQSIVVLQKFGLLPLSLNMRSEIGR